MRTRTTLRLRSTSARTLAALVLPGALGLGGCSQPMKDAPSTQAIPVSIDIREPSVPGGTDITVDLTLDSKAQFGGQQVGLTYSKAAWNELLKGNPIPNSLTVPWGSKVKTITIETWPLKGAPGVAVIFANSVGTNQGDSDSVTITATE